MLVELRILDGYCQLPRKRGQQRGLVLARCGSPRRIRSEQADDLAGHHERDGERGTDPGLPCCRRGYGEPRVAHDVDDLQNRSVARGAESDVEQSLCDPRMRAGQAAARSFVEPGLVSTAEIDSDSLHVEQLGDALHRRLEGVGDRKLRCRLHDHLEQCPGALELERKKPCALAGAERVGRTDAERGQPGELLRVRIVALRMEELQDAEWRPAQRQPRN